MQMEKAVKKRGRSLPRDYVLDGIRECIVLARKRMSGRRGEIWCVFVLGYAINVLSVSAMTIRDNQQLLPRCDDGREYSCL